MRESNLRQKVVQLLHSLDAQAVENPVNPGTPDVEYIGGWIELKYLPEFPKRMDTPIRVPHFKPDQRAWIIKRAMRGGKVFVLIRVADHFFLLDGLFAAKQLGQLPQLELHRNSLAHWYKSINGEQLITVLTTGTLGNARSCT